jgi:hypothetical protein
VLSVDGTRPRPPNTPKALKEWRPGCEASIGHGGPQPGAGGAREALRSVAELAPCWTQGRSSSAFTIRLRATCRYDVSTSSATSAQSTAAAEKSSANHPPGPKYGGT